MASTRHERGFDPRVDLGDSRLRISTEMTTTYNHDEVASPEMTAKAWDDYLHRCGAGAYISARYGSSVRDTTLSPCMMCSGTVLQFGVRQVVVGEDQNFPCMRHDCSL